MMIKTTMAGKGEGKVEGRSLEPKCRSIIGQVEKVS